MLLTYPFTNQVLNDVKGDYLNVYLHLRAKKGTTVIPTIPVPKPAKKGKGTDADQGEPELKLIVVRAARACS